jgi:hypothetical protein
MSHDERKKDKHCLKNLISILLPLIGLVYCERSAKSNQLAKSATFGADCRKVIGHGG